MKDIGKILVFLLGSVLLGALLAPELYWVCVWLGRHANVAFLRDVEFRRVFDRAILFSVLCLLWPLIRWLRAASLREFGLERDPRRWRHLILGAAISLGSMILLAALLIASHRYNQRVLFSWLKLASVLPAAAVVALLEEFLFRGALQGLLERSGSALQALFFVAALYSIVHFLKPPPEGVRPGAVTWLSGFETIPNSFWQFRQPRLVLGGFITLFIVGVILGYARSRTRALWMPIGLHAGWVVGKLGFAIVAIRTPVDAGFWFGPDLLTGVAPVCILACSGLAVAGLLRCEK